MNDTITDRKTASLGELIVTVFDKAASYSTEPVEISRLATGAITHMIRHAHRSLDALVPPASSYQPITG